jgi:hypothetical protein
MKYLKENKSEKPNEDMDKDLEEKIETFLQNRSKIVHHELEHIEKAGRKFVFSFGFLNIFRKIFKKTKKVSIFKKPWYYQLATFVIMASLLAFGAWYGRYLVKAATYTWFQTDWSGGASTSAPFPVHPTNQNNWNKYYSKGGTDTTSAELKLERISN